MEQLGSPGNPDLKVRKARLDLKAPLGRWEQGAPKVQKDRRESAEEWALKDHRVCVVHPALRGRQVPLERLAIQVSLDHVV